MGFSDGNKYLFPGVSGRELIDLSHWLGALITSASIIGTRGITPVRALIDEAASMVPGRRYALCMVTKSRTHDLHAMTFGDPHAAWAAAAEVSAQAHIRYLGTPVRRVLSLIDGKNADMWTGAKGFYKVEPAVLMAARSCCMHRTSRRSPRCIRCGRGPLPPAIKLTLHATAHERAAPSVA